VSVSDENPQRAALIANQIAEEFTSYVGQQAIEQANPYRQELEGQMASLRQQIDDTQQQIEALQQEPDSASTSAQDRIDSLRTLISTLQTSYGQLLLSANAMDLTMASARGTVRMAAPASVPTDPYAPHIMFASILGAFAGFLIAGGSAFVFQLRDRTVKDDMDFAVLAGAPLLATIGKAPMQRSNRGQLFVLHRPASNASESIRLLRANIEFASEALDLKSIAITSPQHNEGKSTVTANLGIALAQSGFRTIIVDADLRKPTQHHIFNVPNEIGLSTVLADPEYPWHTATVNVGISNLALLPSGVARSGTSETLSSRRLSRLLTELRGSADYVLVDTSSLLTASDSLIVAGEVDSVLLICRAGLTPIDAVRQVLAISQRNSLRLIGVVLNRQAGGNRNGYLAERAEGKSRVVVAPPLVAHDGL
jgi:capsular exopolysaccharide synthesis family protein